MKKMFLMLPILVVFLFFAGISSAAPMLGITATMTLTADNHYAAYLLRGGTVFTNLGNNELGAGGSPGTYNWSLPETYNFSVLPGDGLLIGTWNDAIVGQMLLASIQVGSTTVNTDGSWRSATALPIRNTGAQPPTLQEAQAALLLSYSPVPYVGTINQTPWGLVPGLANAKPIGAVPLTPGDQVGETKWYLSPVLVPVTGSDVPEPSTYLLLGAGLLGLNALRRQA